MSTGVLHFSRFHRGDCPRVQKHNEQRESHSNPDIDPSRSHLNEYSIITGMSWNEAADLRISEIDDERVRQGVRKMRHDRQSVVAVGAILGASSGFMNSLTLEKQREFLHECADAFRALVGPENVISESYHFDEATPHCHFVFIPVIYDPQYAAEDRDVPQMSRRPRCVEALSARRLFTPTTLRAFQDEMYESVFKKWGLSERERGSGTKHLNEKEFKAYRDEIKKLEYEIGRLRSDKETTDTELADAKGRLKEAKAALRTAERDKDAAEKAAAKVKDDAEVILKAAKAAEDEANRNLTSSRGQAAEILRKAKSDAAFEAERIKNDAEIYAAEIRKNAVEDGKVAAKVAAKKIIDAAAADRDAAAADRKNASEEARASKAEARKLVEAAKNIKAAAEAKSADAETRAADAAALLGLCSKDGGFAVAVRAVRNALWQQAVAWDRRMRRALEPERRRKAARQIEEIKASAAVVEAVERRMAERVIKDEKTEKERQDKARMLTDAAMNAAPKL